ncbi:MULTISPECIES: hypothetical protein [unclassified Enterococcus]|uniref:hypothetical protein n=1 Tax=unclassified Enterococcus TaxID=2608891 RepID=UPI003F2782F6
MEKSELVINKLLEQTAKDNKRWYSYGSFPDDKTMPYYDHQHLVMEESYLYSPDSISEDGSFFLATFKKMDSKNNRLDTKLLLGFKKSDKHFITISTNQRKLFELKALIEYEEPSKDLSISDILDTFLNDEN